MPFTDFNPTPSAFKACARLVAAFGAFALLACSSSKQLTKEESCQEKWDKAAPKIENKKYVQLKDGLSEIVNSCQGTVFMEDAVYHLAESHFHLKEWVEAESEYSNFLREFPASKKYDEQVRYRLAEVAGEQVESPSRDQTKTLEAILAYETFIGEYPDSKRVDSANAELNKLKDKLVAKQLQIARLYSRMDEPQAAAIYYKNLLKEFGARVNLREINLKLAECYIEMDQFDEAESYLSKFDGIAKDDPFREKVKKGYQDLEKARNKLAKQKKEEQEQSKRQETM